MMKYKYLARFFTFPAVLVSNIMCAAVAYNYRGMHCGIERSCYSAPASALRQN